MIILGGRISSDKRIIGSVVSAETKNFLEKQVEDGNFKTLSKAIDHFLKLGIRTSQAQSLNETEPKNCPPTKSRFRFLRRRD